MKRSTFAILFTILITFSCVFASCNARDSIFGNQSPPDTEEKTDYTSMIKELEDKIVDLKQDQYISESKRTEEILRLEKLILELKQSTGDKSDTDIENNTETDTESDTETDTDEKEPTGKFLFTAQGTEATITGYTGNDRFLTIPSSIDGYTVTAIADDAFISDTLETIIIPDGIKKIGWFAFKECSELKYVTIPDSVISIGYSAFPSKGTDISLICSSTSFAAKYAESYGLSVTLM